MITKFIGKTLRKSGLQWCVYSGTDHIVDRFSASDWHKIFFNYSTEKELRGFVKTTRAATRILILRNTATGESWGFVALMLIEARTIALHGGAWASSPADRMAIYRGMFLLLRRLLENGAKVVSSSADNPQAVKFMKSLGFRIFSYRYNRTHYHITMSLMLKSSYYRRFAII
ncbi:MAG: hypothetical protein K2K08_09135 [Paramuribaculum sp.]|nr:hypothetical protein [Paramuribaculum sp.]